MHLATAKQCCWQRNYHLPLAGIAVTLLHLTEVQLGLPGLGRILPGV